MDRVNILLPVMPEEPTFQDLMDLLVKHWLLNPVKGLAVITQQQAALWTDGRYFLQASKQLDQNWTLMKSGMPGVLNKEDWLNQVLPEKSNVGIDPKLISMGNRGFDFYLKQKVPRLLRKNYKPMDMDYFLFQTIW
jgi:hypothetical protein